MSTLIVNEVRALNNAGQTPNLSMDSANVSVGGYLSLGSGNNSSLITSTSATINGNVQGVAFISTEPTNVPMTIASTAKVANLNSDQVDGYDIGITTGDVPYLGGTGATAGLDINLIGKSIPSSALVDVNSVQTLTSKSFEGGVAIEGNLTVTAATGATTSITCEGDIIAFHTSDIRLKKNLDSISEDPLADLQKIQGVRFEWIEDDKKDVGVIAQEVEEVLPEAVTKRKDGTLAVRYELLSPLIIEAVNTLTSICEDLDTRLEELTDKVRMLEH